MTQKNSACRGAPLGTFSNAKSASLGGPTDSIGKKINSTTDGYCITHNNHLSSLLDQASRFMNRADAAGDFDGWVAHFTIWQSLLSAKHGLPWPGTVSHG